jgi:hypothetical protein
MPDLNIGYTLDELRTKLAEARAEKERLLSINEPVSQWLENLIVDLGRRLAGHETETEGETDVKIVD